MTDAPLVTPPPKRLLICADWFDPAIKAGGPIRSCVNLVEFISGSAEVLVLTGNRDLGEKSPLVGTTPNVWQRWKTHSTVFYASSALQRMKEFIRTMHVHKPDCVYLNSMFSPASTLFPLLWMWLCRSKVRIVLAPRGMLKPSALNQKPWKKKTLLSILRMLRLTGNVCFHATSGEEFTEIRNVFDNARVAVIANVPTPTVKSLPNRTYRIGVADLCFVGRVHPIKNLHWLLRVMKDLDCACNLRIIGPLECESYVAECQHAVDDLPDQVTVNFVGPASAEVVKRTLIESDAMILPTLGENFGHAIFESLAVGTPVIISDQTIWDDLETKNAGWAISLDDAPMFADAITQLAGMDEAAHKQLREGALGVATEFQQSQDFAAQYDAMFFTE